MPNLLDIEVYVEYLKSTGLHKMISAVECTQKNSFRYIRQLAEEDI